jgi:hypothetical protein
MSRDQFLAMRREFINLMEILKREHQAFQIIKSENIEVRICLN